MGIRIKKKATKKKAAKKRPTGIKSMRVKKSGETWKEYEHYINKVQRSRDGVSTDMVKRYRTGMGAKASRRNLVQDDSKRNAAGSHRKQKRKRRGGISI
jgi:predicted NAD-dependent protein-ADP-ribosyltransferase YbiA (DUF1768 family)